MHLRARLIAFALVAAGCGDVVSPAANDAEVMPADARSVDAGAPADARTSCRLPGGGVCLLGQSCPAGDGCNTCSCYGGQEFATCTTIGCVVPDAGVPDDAPDASMACGGASIGPNGQYCAGPTDAPLPLACCTGWDCDVRTVMCFSVPPTCPAGEVPAVAMRCYGPCVAATHCAPMPCGGGCPAGWTCDAASSTCRHGA
jgi:hypothetical protein